MAPWCPVDQPGPRLEGAVGSSPSTPQFYLLASVTRKKWGRERVNRHPPCQTPPDSQGAPKGQCGAAPCCPPWHWKGLAGRCVALCIATALQREMKPLAGAEPRLHGPMSWKSSPAVGQVLCGGCVCVDFCAFLFFLSLFFPPPPFLAFSLFLSFAKRHNLSLPLSLARAL